MRRYLPAARSFPRPVLRLIAAVVLAFFACGDSGPGGGDGGGISDGAAGGDGAAAGDAGAGGDARTGADAGTTDGGGGPDAATACELPTTYRFAWEGGLGPWSDAQTLSPPASLVITRTATGGGATTTCTVPLLPCGSGDAVDLGDLLAALGDPDVAAAFAETGMPFFGRDDRPADGQALAVRRADGRGFFVGGECTGGGPPCRAVPAGLRALAAILRSLYGDALAKPACASLGP